MRPGDRILAVRSRGHGHTLTFIAQTVHVYSDLRLDEIEVACARCGQRQVITDNEFIHRIGSRGEYVLDLSSMPNSEFRNRIFGHDPRCWERSYSGRTIPDADYITSTAIPLGNQGLAYRGHPVRIEVDEYGEQHLVRESPNLVEEMEEGLREARSSHATAMGLLGEAGKAFKEAIKDTVKPLTKAERRKKQHNKLVEVNTRLIRDD